MTDRYFAQSTETNKVFASRHRTSWQVFDRNHQDFFDHNLSKPIAMCIDKATAFRIMDLFNATERNREP